MGQEREPQLSVPAPETPQAGQDPALLRLTNILDSPGSADELLGRVCLPAQYPATVTRLAGSAPGADHKASYQQDVGKAGLSPPARHQPHGSWGHG